MKPLIIANWKMNLNLEKSFAMMEYLEKSSYENFMIAISAPYLAYFAKSFYKIKFCAQDVSTVEGYGAYTGEMSADLIKSCKISHSIVGHSERRQLMRDSNMVVQKKADNCIKAGIEPIICVGENLEFRRDGNYKEFIFQQINESIPRSADSFIVAYEPVWSIGTGIVPTTEELSEMFYLIKHHPKLIRVAKNIQLVYGGSVNSSNCKHLLSIENIDGLLVGSASLSKKELDLILS
jgi:triosephosphate isomerase (TIM)